MNAELEKANIVSELYKKYKKLILLYIYSRINCYHTAEELTHDIFCKLCTVKYIPIESESATKAYLIKSAHNKIIDHHRRKQTRIKTIDIRNIEEASMDYLKSTTLDDIFVKEEIVSTLHRHINKLKEDEKQIYLQRFFGQKGSRKLSSTEYRKRNKIIDRIDKEIRDDLNDIVELGQDLE